MSISITNTAKLLNHSQTNINIKTLANKIQTKYSNNISVKSKFNLSQDFQIQFFYQNELVDSVLQYEKDMIIYFKLVNYNSGETFSDLFKKNQTIIDSNNSMYTIASKSNSDVSYNKTGLVNGMITVHDVVLNTTKNIQLQLYLSNTLQNVVQKQIVSNSFQVGHHPGSGS